MSFVAHKTDVIRILTVNMFYGKTYCQNTSNKITELTAIESGERHRPGQDC